MSRRTKPTTYTDEETVYRDVNKTLVKKEMHDLQDLGTALLELPDTLLDSLGMHSALREALTELRRLRNLDARQRQTRYIGKLIRDADPEVFRAAIASYRLGKKRDVLGVREVEDWRERLLADDAGLAAWLEVYPAGDSPQLRAALRNARRERDQTLAVNPAIGVAPPNKGRFYRELFQKMRAVMQSV